MEIGETTMQEKLEMPITEMVTNEQSKLDPGAHYRFTYQGLKLDPRKDWSHLWNNSSNAIPSIEEAALHRQSGT